MIRDTTCEYYSTLFTRKCTVQNCLLKQNLIPSRAEQFSLVCCATKIQVSDGECSLLKPHKATCLHNDLFCRGFTCN